MYDVPFGYRKFFHWKKHGISGEEICYSSDDVLSNVAKYNGIDNCGISVSTYIEGIPYLLYLAFDFDDETLDKPKEEAIRLYKFFVISGYDVTLNYSGRKGFHVLVSVKPQVYSKKQLYDCHLFFKKTLNLTTVDEHLFGDISRKIRLPNTINMGSGESCFTIAHNEGELFDINDFFKGDDDFYDAEFGEYKNGDTKHYDYYCLDRFIKDRDLWFKTFPDEKTFEPFAEIRFSWVAKELWKGRTPKEIYDEVKTFGWDDFNPRITQNQIKAIYRRGNYEPYSCRKLMKLGICLNEECKWWREHFNKERIEDDENWQIKNINKIKKD